MSSADRIEAEARGEIEWLEARQRRNLEVRERLKWIRRCLRLLGELRERDCARCDFMHGDLRCCRPLGHDGAHGRLVRFA